VGDQIAMIYDGKVIFSGTPDSFRENDHPHVKQFTESASLRSRT